MDDERLNSYIEKKVGINKDTTPYATIVHQTIRKPRNEIEEIIEDEEEILYESPYRSVTPPPNLDDILDVEYGKELVLGTLHQDIEYDPYIQHPLYQRYD